MSTRTKDFLWDMVKVVGASIIGALFGVVVSASTIKSDLRAVESEVRANKYTAAQDLANAVEMRKKDQALLEQSIKEVLPALKALADGQKESASNQAKTTEAIARLEVTGSYLAKGQDEIKQTLKQH